MRFVATTFDDVWIVEVDPVRDQRGAFARTFCAEAFAAQGLCSNFQQHSRSLTLQRGTVRGLHFQRAPHAEVKLVSCLKGAIHDVIVDLRSGSSSFKQWQAFELTAANQRQLYVPEGFAHGFQALSDNVDVSYMISKPYNADSSSGVRYNDPAFGVEWPLEVAMVSDRDRHWPAFEG